MIATRHLVAFVAAVLAFGPRGGGDVRPAERDNPVRLEIAARRAVRWLIAQQQEDGSWRSPQYGVLRSGQAYTPFVLHALLCAPVKFGPVPKGVIERGLGFIRAHVDADGALGYADPDVLEYPVYATSYALRVLVKAAPSDPLIPKMARWLGAMQLAEEKGFGIAAAVHGGWSFGVRGLPAGEPGHVDLAHTRRALEALREARALGDPVMARAKRFLGLLQKRPEDIVRFAGVPGFEHVGGAVPCDGGFFFSPVVLVANKALHEKPAERRAAYFRSYSTATADGALALIAAGASRDDERVVLARAWLEAHAGVDPEGIPADHPEPWVAALRFYHLAAFTEAAAALDLGGDWRKTFAARVVGLQLQDGSFVNADSPLMKEDDPVLATSLALAALNAIVR